jgi:hypothetical protein
MFLEYLKVVDLNKSVKDLLLKSFEANDFNFCSEILVSILENAYSIEIDQLYAYLPQNQYEITQYS